MGTIRVHFKSLEVPNRPGLSSAHLELPMPFASVEIWLQLVKTILLSESVSDCIVSIIKIKT